MATAPAAAKQQSPAPAAGPKFKKISVPEIDAWYDIETEGSFTGKIAGYKSYNDEKDVKRHVVLVRLLKPCTGKLKGGETRVVKVGEVLGVGLRQNLMPLLEYIDSQPVIRVKALDKVSIGHGQSMWNFDVEVEEDAVRNTPPNSGSDSIPF